MNDETWLIYDREENGWWRKISADTVPKETDAGLYTFGHALDICKTSVPHADGGPKRFFYPAPADVSERCGRQKPPNSERHLTIHRFTVHGALRQYRAEVTELGMTGESAWHWDKIWAVKEASSHLDLFRSGKPVTEKSSKSYEYRRPTTQAFLFGLASGLIIGVLSCVLYYS